jgi:hypothetical protein
VKSLAPCRLPAGTNLDVLALRGVKHHHLLHGTSWHIELGPAGTLETTNLDGRALRC